MTTPFLITGYQHSLPFWQAFERELEGGNVALKNTQFCPPALYFGGLPRGTNTKMSRHSYFKLNKHSVSIRANQTFSILFLIFLGKTFGILNLVSEFKIWNTISYCLILFQQQGKSKNDCLSVELAVFSYNLGGNSKTVPFTFWFRDILPCFS